MAAGMEHPLDFGAVETISRVRPATEDDTPYILQAFQYALSPYYGGDHAAHARRLIQTHLAGGSDPRGFLSSRQLLLILWHGGQRRGILNLVFKRQKTCKISPLILYPREPHSRGFGAVLLSVAEQEARKAGARQLFCTVTASNRQCLGFFLQFGFVECGSAEGQYKEGETEVLLRRSLDASGESIDASDLISVFEATRDDEWVQARALLAKSPGSIVEGIGDDRWIDALRTCAGNAAGFSYPECPESWVYCAKDRRGNYRAAALVTSKKGGALKVMPIAAVDIDAFRALVVDLPILIADKGRKVYIHHAPSPSEVAVLQESNWHHEAQLPGAYHNGIITEQWACSLGKDAPMTTLRIQPRYLALVESGLKTLEVRVGYEHIRRIKPGTTIKLMAGPRYVPCYIEDIRRYPSLQCMAENEDMAKALPGLGAESALSQLRRIYPPEKERYGIFVFAIKPC